ncbi:MAG: hypothetical protein ACIAQF_05205 [Phycisphaerales bacterium JB065]
MKPYRLATIGALVVFLSTGLVATAVVSSTLSRPAAPVDREAGVANLDQRLRALSPARPMDYFKLAEELAYLSAIAPNQRVTALRMATQLYVLAYELDRVRGGEDHLGRSVCLALADIAPPEDRDWLLAMAASFGVSADSRNIESAISAGAGEDTARADVAEALGRYRAVERQPLTAILRRVDARRQMREAGVSQDDTDWAMGLLERGLNRPYCPECRNQRLVRAGTTDQTIEQRLCGTCFGNPQPDPPLTRAELRRMLSIEAALLNADARTWTAELYTGGAEPIADLDPSALAERYGVDASKPYWIPSPDAALLGNWTADPSANPSMDE